MVLALLFSNLADVNFEIGSGTIGRDRIPFAWIYWDSEGWKLAGKNLEKIRKFGTPTKPKEVPKLLGAAGYYRMLIQDEDRVDAASEILKDEFQRGLVIDHLAKVEPVTLVTDTSVTHVSALRCFSKKFSSSQMKYSVHFSSKLNINGKWREA